MLDCSATDLMGQFVGQTGPKVIAKFEEALGHVLFVDEAYRLATGPYAKEAIDEIVDCLTKDRYKGKLLVILAGYDNDMNRLLSVNSGLSSRFPEEVIFKNLSVDMCIKLLKQRLQKALNTSPNEQASCSELDEIEHAFEEFMKLQSWGNGRDIETLAQRITSNILRSRGDNDLNVGTLTWSDVLAPLKHMLNERQQRDKFQLGSFKENDLLQQQLQPSINMPIPPSRQQSKLATSIVETKDHNDPDDSIPEDNADADDSSRDAGVSDAIWNQLKLDKVKQRQAEAALEQQIKQQEVQKQLDLDEAAQLEAQAQDLSSSGSENEELQRKQEQLRLQKATAKQKADENAELYKKLLIAKIEALRLRHKLLKLGRCPAGFTWIKQSGGYRCAGGSHWLSDKNVASYCG